MDDLTDDELVAEHRRAKLLARACDNAGEPDARDHHVAIQRALAREAEDRGLSL